MRQNILTVDINNIRSQTIKFLERIQSTWKISQQSNWLINWH